MVSFAMTGRGERQRNRYRGRPRKQTAPIRPYRAPCGGPLRHPVAATLPDLTGGRRSRHRLSDRLVPSGQSIQRPPCLSFAATHVQRITTAASCAANGDRARVATARANAEAALEVVREAFEVLAAASDGGEAPGG